MLHLYTPDHGRVGAVAKGVRRVKSRMGGRLEPLSRVRLVLHQGRSELCTVSQADTLNPHAAVVRRVEVQHSIGLPVADGAQDDSFGLEGTGQYSCLLREPRAPGALVLPSRRSFSSAACSPTPG